MRMHLPESRILIVDDSQSVRESLGWLIEDEAGLTVVGSASTGLDAIRQANELQPHLVILDIELPDTDGFLVTRQLKALPQPPLVVLLSVHGDAGSKTTRRGGRLRCLRRKRFGLDSIA